jgi:hypothetical protein
MSYIGNSSTNQAFAPAIDYFTGNGTQTAFTLTRPIVSAAQVKVTVENVAQNPQYAFGISGNTITFTSAPPANSLLPVNIWVEYISPITQVIQPAQGTVNDLQIGTLSKLPLTSGILGGGNSSLMKNRLINGAMVIDQRNAGASVTPTNLAYTLDRWQAHTSQASKYSVQQNAGSVTPPPGYSNYLGVTSLSAYALSVGDYFNIMQKVEGFNVADLNWGTANAQPITISAWVRSSLTGTFGGVITNSANNYSYPFTYAINTANSWTQISVTVPGATTGIWLSNNGIGLWALFGLGNGSTVSGTPGSWSANAYYGATGATSVVGTNGATFYITGVQLEVGSSATGFEYRQYGQELALCQRYFYKDFPATVSSAFSAGLCYNSTTVFYAYRYPVTMRSAPTLSYSALSDINVILGNNVLTPTSITSDGIGTSSCRLNIGVTGAAVGNGSIFQGVSSNAFLSFSAEL